MGRVRLLGIALVATLAASGALAGTAAASRKVLDLDSFFNEELNLLPPGGRMEIWAYGNHLRFAGAKQTLECEKTSNIGLEGYDVTNGQTGDTIELTEALGILGRRTVGGCGEPRENVVMSGFPLTLTLTAKETASLGGAAFFTFASGCNYMAEKLSATFAITTHESYSYSNVELYGRIARTEGSPKTCEKSFSVSGIWGTLEYFPGDSVYSEVVSR